MPSKICPKYATCFIYLCHAIKSKLTKMSLASFCQSRAVMKPFVLRTDASGAGVAAGLLQENGGKLYPLSYATRS